METCTQARATHQLFCLKFPTTREISLILVVISYPQEEIKYEIQEDWLCVYLFEMGIHI
jgi:hypothetical protein